MEELITSYARLAGELGLAGAASFALVRVWQQMIAQADNHRKDAAAQDTVHREEIKALEQRHREDLISLEQKHREDLMTLHRESRDNIGEIVMRNMASHEERNRVQTMLGMWVAEAFTANGVKVPDPYPNIDEAGREDPRK
jgi:hypothetical protein